VLTPAAYMAITMPSREQRVVQELRVKDYRLLTKCGDRDEELLH
jgi:hypothetical protein